LDGSFTYGAGIRVRD